MFGGFQRIRLPKQSAAPAMAGLAHRDPRHLCGRLCGQRALRCAGQAARGGAWLPRASASRAGGRCARRGVGRLHLCVHDFARPPTQPVRQRDRVSGGRPTARARVFDRGVPAADRAPSRTFGGRQASKRRTAACHRRAAHCARSPRRCCGGRATPMTTLDSMTTHAEPSPLERLQSLIHEQAGPAREWRSKLPTLRAQCAATAAMLEEARSHANHSAT